MALYFDVFRTNQEAYDREQDLKQRLFSGWVGNGNVLDVGFASSPNRYLRGFVVGVDKADVKPPSNYSSVFVKDISFGRLSFDDGFFSGVCMGDVLEHMDRPFEALLEVNRLLKDGGILALSIPNVFYIPHAFRSSTGWYEEADDMSFSEHVYSFSIYNIRLLLSRTGFEFQELKGYRIKIPFVKIAYCSTKVPFWVSTQLLIKARKVGE